MNSPALSAGETQFSVKRLTIAVPRVREFQRSYEKAVPTVPLDEVMARVQRRASWSEMEQLIANSAPHGFLIYFKNDAHPVMQLAGDTAECIAYLMGNHIIAERMFRHDPRANAVRTAAHGDMGGLHRRGLVQCRSAQHAVCQLLAPQRSLRWASSSTGSWLHFWTRCTSMCRACCSRAKASGTCDLPRPGREKRVTWA